jgi:hypothetical protein
MFRFSVDSRSLFRESTRSGGSNIHDRHTSATTRKERKLNQNKRKKKKKT